MKISIIIPTFNRRELLSLSVESILKQTFRDFEIIVVDDGSTDGTRELFTTTITDSRIRFLRLAQNQGAYVARNTGMEAAQGEYILHWDSDDDLTPHALERLVEVAQTYPEKDIIAAPATFMKQGVIMEIEDIPSGPLSYSQLMKGILPMNTVIFLIRRSIIQEIRFCGPNIDFIFFDRLRRAATWFYFNEKLGMIRLLSDSLSETIARQKPNIQKSIRRSSCLVTYLKEFGEDLLQYQPKKYAGCAYGAALGLLLAGNRREAGQWAREAYRTDARITHLFLSICSAVPGSSWILHGLYRLKGFLANKR